MSTETYEYDNMTVQELFDMIEVALIGQEEMNGVQIDDIQGRSWFVELINKDNSRIN
jgi:hypothetical protein